MVAIQWWVTSLLPWSSQCIGEIRSCTDTHFPLLRTLKDMYRTLWGASLCNGWGGVREFFGLRIKNKTTPPGLWGVRTKAELWRSRSWRAPTWVKYAGGLIAHHLQEARLCVSWLQVRWVFRRITWYFKMPLSTWQTELHRSVKSSDHELTSLFGVAFEVVVLKQKNQTISEVEGKGWANRVKERRQRVEPFSERAQDCVHGLPTSRVRVWDSTTSLPFA